MTPTETVAIVSVITTVVASLVVPWLLRRRAALKSVSDTEVVSWQSITAVLQKERDVLRSQLDVIQGENRKTIRDLDTDYANQLVVARQRITQLEAEMARILERQRDDARDGGHP
jgi:hypothetical protein